MNERYEREIDELLYRLEGRMRRESLSRRLGRRFGPHLRGVQGAFAAFLRRPPTEQFMITAMLLVVASFAANIFGWGKLAFYASILSIACFVLGLALSVASRHSPRQRRRWRGRELDYDVGGPSIWTQLRNWLRRHRR